MNATAARSPRHSHWTRLRDMASLYLPVLIIGALALSTFWLVSNTPGPVDASRPQAVRSDPDYRMQNFAMRTYGADGHLKTEIKGDQGRHFPDTDRLEVDEARIRGYDAAGQLMTATARQAISLQGGDEVELRKDAVVVREAGPNVQGQMQPRMEFHGDELRAFPSDNKVQSDLPVLIIRGQDRITANRLDYDHNTRVVDLQGRVRGVLQPRTPPAGGGAGTR
ncbi:MAG: Lipopolysaccharide export system protein LptC [Paracidovorax wautersii]|uniref:Lipopolysaccharide export system protein LptC n=1 Tax=Paracidovorax wautersii TaxID=1177982 RepID=A0A7V8FLL4_9BURK|nr:MAG: Lipopolysaccharide export system protein LptC [Paracidovorax wautersii]